MRSSISKTTPPTAGLPGPQVDEAVERRADDGREEATGKSHPLDQQGLQRRFARRPRPRRSRPATPPQTRTSGRRVMSNARLYCKGQNLLTVIGWSTREAGVCGQAGLRGLR